MKITPIFCLILAHQGKIYLHAELDLNLEIYWDPQPRASAFYWYFYLTAHKELLQWRWILLVLTFPLETKGLLHSCHDYCSLNKVHQKFVFRKQVFATRSTWGLIQKPSSDVYISFLDVGYNSCPICNSCNNSAGINFTDLGNCSSIQLLLSSFFMMRRFLLAIKTKWILHVKSLHKLGERALLTRLTLQHLK